MSRSAAMYLHDMLRSARAIQQFSEGRDYQDYLSDLLFRSGVERQFEIIGEALNQLGKIDPGAQARVRNFQSIIGFRNILIHGYAELDDSLVWNAIAR
jgi:uncharacterized protein with HEPN domain